MSAAVLEPTPPRSSRPRNVLPPGKRRTAGEAKVWLVSVGLSLGLLMVVCLLGLILKNGITVFWPRGVVDGTEPPARLNPAA